jgi:hypothetical protein
MAIRVNHDGFKLRRQRISNMLPEWFAIQLKQTLICPPIRLALPPASTTPVIALSRFTDIASFIVGLTLLTYLHQIKEHSHEM